MRPLIIHFAVGALPPVVFYFLWLIQGPESASVLWVANLFAGIAPHVPVLEDYVTYAVQNRRGDLVPLMIAVYSYDFLWVFAGSSIGVVVLALREDSRKFVLRIMASRYKEPIFGITGGRAAIGSLFLFPGSIYFYNMSSLYTNNPIFGTKVLDFSSWVLVDFLASCMVVLSLFLTFSTVVYLALRR